MEVHHLQAAVDIIEINLCLNFLLLLALLLLLVLRILLFSLLVKQLVINITLERLGLVVQKRKSVDVVGAAASSWEGSRVEVCCKIEVFSTSREAWASLCAGRIGKVVQFFLLE